MNILEVTKDGASAKPITGLYDAKVGDIINIGIEGTRQKRQAKIVRVTPNKVTDDDGNVFYRNGMIYRRKDAARQLGPPGSKVYATIATQKGLDKAHDKQRRDYIAKQDWYNLPADKIEKILKILRVTFGDAQRLRRYNDGE